MNAKKQFSMAPNLSLRRSNQEFRATNLKTGEGENVAVLIQRKDDDDSDHIGFVFPSGRGCCVSSLIPGYFESKFRVYPFAHIGVSVDAPINVSRPRKALARINLEEV